MKQSIRKCPGCGINKELVPSNNPLVESTCLECITKSLDYSKTEHGDFFCRTYNFEFKPELWIKMAKEFKNRTFMEYALFMTKDETYEGKNLDTWQTLDEEWRLVQTHEELISKIEPIKEGYMQRNHIKWGSNYTFQELITLDSLFVNTLKANNVSSPMQKDAIKKACKMSIALDRAITNGDSKEINDLSKAYQNFVKTAKIDDLIEAASQDVISNVSQLVQYIEDNGYQFKFYDQVDRDIVDSSLKDMQQFTKRLVLDSTGLDIAFETINSSLTKQNEMDRDAESFEKAPLEDLFINTLDKENEEFDREVSSQDIEIEDDEDEEFF